MRKIERPNKDLISVNAAMIKHDVSRDTIYRLIRPYRSGKKVYPPKVRSKRYRGRRWVHNRDLREYLNAGPTEHALKPMS